ncbi:M14 family metallopeptidase [Terrimonas alba]|uniref:M14 family metallopeptidase n=1 Tax=Terrimonas alba TaxID=3349636 RepID=UPI0035F3AB2E
MRKILLLASIFRVFVMHSQDITTKFELSGGKETPLYNEIINWWKKLDERSGKVKMFTMGMTDAGFPLHLIVVSNNGDNNFSNIRKNNKPIILINNGIHPGEPDGIDASMLMVKDIVTSKYKIPDNIVLAIIPVYNIGGCLNRSVNYRIDQNGPVEKGFRGNSRNLDLNRDFIKCDSKDARAFTEIFHLTDPDVFVDNHVSNGADYQHIMTLLTSQHSKLGGVMGEFINKRFEPALYSLMKEKNYDLVPYVNVWGETPDKGWSQFWDSPRYGSGYGSLWHSFSFVPETHMLKPYDQRVKATYALMQCFIDFTSKNSVIIKQTREQAKQAVKTQAQFPLNWKLDKSKFTTIGYRGYTAGYKPSEVSGHPRLYYDRGKPYEMQVPFYNYYEQKEFIQKPKAYIIPQGWWKVIDLLKLNEVEMLQLKKDTTIEVEVYRIEDYKTAALQYEMHHPNSDVKISSQMQKMNFRKGDYYIPMNQEANRFLIETLEPQMEDSYFAWNYFDAILGQKEGYSAYAFEDIAAEYLKTNPELKTKLEQKRSADTSFAKNGAAQLNFVYQNSSYFEPVHMRYPVYRMK